MKRVRTTARLGTTHKTGRGGGVLEDGAEGTIGTGDDADRYIPHLVDRGEGWEVMFPDGRPDEFVAITADWYEVVRLVDDLPPNVNVKTA